MDGGDGVKDGVTALSVKDLLYLNYGACGFNSLLPLSFQQPDDRSTMNTIL